MTQLVRKAVIPAAGYGTRFLPISKAVPKEMLPLVDKPVIQYVVEEAIHAGIENLVLVTGRGKQAIENHFDVAHELEETLDRKGRTLDLKLVQDITHLVQFSYVRQGEPLGLGHAVLCGRHAIGELRGRRGHGFGRRVAKRQLQDRARPAVEVLERRLGQSR